MNKNERRNHSELNGMAMSRVISMRSFKDASFFFIRTYPHFSNLRKVLSHRENTSGRYNLTSWNRRSSVLFVRACHATESSVAFVD